jgi:hypothetical protein
MAPLSLVLLALRGRPRPVRTTPPEVQLKGGKADAALGRRIFARAIAERVHLGPTEMTDYDSLRRALRRAGVSDTAAAEAATLLTRLDESVFGASSTAADPANQERARVLLRAIDEGARSRAAIAARRAERGTLVVFLFTVASATAWAMSQDVVASTVFRDGLAAYDAREFGSARQAFFELAQARPRAADAWYNFATASWQLEDTAAAVIGWQRAMRLDPMKTDVRARLRFAPGTPRLWEGVPPVSLTMLAIGGASLWFLAFIMFAVARRPPAEFVSATLGPILSISFAAASDCNCAFSTLSNSR